MGTAMVEEATVLTEHAPQVTFVHDKQVVKTLLSDPADPALGDGVRVGCPVGRADDLIEIEITSKIKRRLAMAEDHPQQLTQVPAEPGQAAIGLAVRTGWAPMPREDDASLFALGEQAAEAPVWIMEYDRGVRGRFHAPDLLAQWPKSVLSPPAVCGNPVRHGYVASNRRLLLASLPSGAYALPTSETDVCGRAYALVDTRADPLTLARSCCWQAAIRSTEALGNIVAMVFDAQHTLTIPAEVPAGVSEHTLPMRSPTPKFRVNPSGNSSSPCPCPRTTACRVTGGPRSAGSVVACSTSASASGSSDASTA